MMEQQTDYIQLAQDWLLLNGPNILAAILILIVGRWIVKWISVLVRKGFVKSGMDETLVRFLEKLIYYSLLVAVILAAADQVGIKTTSFLAILGAAGLAIGLALKDSLSNFASGVMLILFKPFTVGDVVTIAGVTGPSPVSSRTVEAPSWAPATAGSSKPARQTRTHIRTKYRLSTKSTPITNTNLQNHYSIPTTEA